MITVDNYVMHSLQIQTRITCFQLPAVCSSNRYRTVVLLKEPNTSFFHWIRVPIYMRTIFWKWFF